MLRSLPTANSSVYVSEIVRIVCRAQIGTISDALSLVADIRNAQKQNPFLSNAVQSIKLVQIHRFRYSYSDVLDHPRQGPAADFFLSELYSERDLSLRDQQFSRIAPALQRLFPKLAVSTATTLTQLHAISEQLDHAMAVTFIALSPGDLSLRSAFDHYVAIWRMVDNSEARFEQLNLVLELGHDLAKLTRQPGLRTMLKLMRGPAAAASLQQLQAFLERGFDTFLALERSPVGVSDFLSIVQQREDRWLRCLFDAEVPSIPSSLNWPELEYLHK